MILCSIPLSKAINECGRPLGLKFHPRDANKLYVAYSRKGLLLYHLDTKQWETLVDCRQPGEGVTPLMILNDMVPLSNDSVFFTDMSDKYGFHEVEEEVVEGRPHGRLFHYNPTDKSLRVVLESLHSPNGMAVGPDEQFVLFPETSRARVIRLDRKVLSKYFPHHLLPSFSILLILLLPSTTLHSLYLPFPSSSSSFCHPSTFLIPSLQILSERFKSWYSRHLCRQPSWTP